MTIQKLMDFLKKCPRDRELQFGIIDSNSGEWYDLIIQFLCDEKDMGDGTIGIQFEENDEYNIAKAQTIVDDIREITINAFDRYTPYKD